MANWCVWIPAQMINFGFVPLQFQVLFNNALGLFWNAYLSYSSSIAEECVPIVGLETKDRPEDKDETTKE
jgi:hypothetical protein